MRWNNVLPSRYHVVFIAVFLWSLVFPFAAVGQGNYDIVGNVAKRTHVRLPGWYENIVQSFIANNKVIKNNAQFIEDFIVKEMWTKWWINDDNQLLFIYCAILYNYGEDLFTWEDWNKNRMTQFESALDKIEDCQNRYNKEFTAYLEQRIQNAQERSNNAQQRYDNAQQRSNNAQERYDNAQQRSSEAKEEAMRLDSIWIKQMVDFYDIYITSPNIVKQDELDFMKESRIKIINHCKEYRIDYRTILLKETRDEKKVEAILKFYGIAD